ncbi:hypothetical protein P3T27_005302 [Kitasatospora sp. MAA19]|uniref:hypothetical protein n=1 Tax=unclassified Kitasatospora TaxID=2633591 RepID=UPI00247D753D|nr:hypothetical protein [Kitasatospora sp. MAA19]
MIAGPGRAGVLLLAEGRSLAYSGTAPSAVQLRHQVPVRGACGGEVLVALGEFGAEVEDPLLQLADAAGERFDVGGGTEPGGFPSSLSKRFRQTSFEPGDVRGQTAVAGREVRDVGQQRPAADLRSGRRAGRRLARSGENGRVQVTVPMDQTAVDAGGAGNGGDGDLLAVRGQLVEDLEDTGPPPVGVRCPCSGQVVR